MLNKEYQGKGYAYEAASAFYDYLFLEKGARRVYAYTEEDNLVTFVNNLEGTPKYENTIQYAILKKEWNSRSNYAGNTNFK